MRSWTTKKRSQPLAADRCAFGEFTCTECLGLSSISYTLDTEHKKGIGMQTRHANTNYTHLTQQTKRHRGALDDQRRDMKRMWLEPQNHSSTHYHVQHAEEDRTMHTGDHTGNHPLLASSNH